MSVEKSSKGVKKVCGEAVTAFLWYLHDRLCLNARSQAPQDLAIHITTHQHYSLRGPGHEGAFGLWKGWCDLRWQLVLEEVLSAKRN